MLFEVLVDAGEALLLLTACFLCPAAGPDYRRFADDVHQGLYLAVLKLWKAEYRWVSTELHAEAYTAKGVNAARAIAAMAAPRNSLKRWTVEVGPAPVLARGLTIDAVDKEVRNGQ